MARLFSADGSDGLITELLGSQNHLYCAGIRLDVRALGQELHGTQRWGRSDGLGMA